MEGVDYGATGEVKKVDVSRIRERLDGGCVVILSNLGYSSTGEVLNCKYVFLFLWMKVPTSFFIFHQCHFSIFVLD